MQDKYRHLLSELLATASIKVELDLQCVLRLTACFGSSQNVNKRKTEMMFVCVRQLDDHVPIHECLHSEFMQADMKVIGIGASVTLFGVLTSTMWIQVRIIGFLFTIGITALLHPLFWEYGMAR